ncbi:MAG TPA: bile acid:sodium symporter family protein [Burkholderiaceae bacterium]|jgi:sodium/bile acid cotransporter 7|nr:bile acid:sodium symporter family protein [Burkholderiaceae bacterium]
MKRPSFVPDNFTLALVAVVALASIAPAQGGVARLFDGFTSFAIGLLFFLHGAKLSRDAIRGGLLHWRLHLLVFACTFVLFPLLGWALRPLLQPLVTREIYTGVLFLCVLPATVQSAIAFTSIARGNIPAAVCSASASTMLGVFVTPVLVSLVVVPNAAASNSLDSIVRILLQLMLPFVVGHLARPWIAGWVHRRKQMLGFVDRGSILLVVYTAFSAAVIEGLWKQVPPLALAGLLVVCAVLLACALFLTGWFARRLGFDKADEITIVFCGSKKSLASGIPMAKVLFPAQAVGAIVLPLMLFHQMQLMVCAVLAQRLARRAEKGSVGEVSGAIG